jgi:hypothetical protein
MRLPALLAATLALAGCAGPVEVDANRALDYGGPLALERTRSLARTVDALVAGTGNFGRRSQALDRIHELGLDKFARTEWIDWWTPQTNVIVEIPGTGADGNEPLVYVTAHYDKIDVRPDMFVSRILVDMLEPLLSWSYMSCGAVDNATGCAVALEMARELSLHPRPETYRCILFGGEESGLRGSRCYVAGLSEHDVQRTRLVVNVDSVAVKEGVNGVLENRDHPEITRAALKIANERDFDLVQWSLPGNFGGDDESFANTSPWTDVARSFLFNLYGFVLPQRSYFTAPKSMPTVSFASPDSIDALDTVASIVPIPVGCLHGPRDRPSRVDAWLLYEQFEIVRELTALPASKLAPKKKRASAE